MSRRNGESEEKHYSFGMGVTGKQGIVGWLQSTLKLLEHVMRMNEDSVKVYKGRAEGENARRRLKK